MDSVKKLGPLAVNGRVVQSRNQGLFSHIEIVIKAFVDHFNRFGMQNVRQVGNDGISFKGGKRGFQFGRNDFGLKENIDGGTIKIHQEGPMLVGSYSIDFFGRFALKFFLPLALVALLVVFQDDARPVGLLVIGIGLFIFLGITLLIIRLAMNRELPRAIQTAENMVEFLTGMYDTSSVEPHHRSLNPSDMLRSANFYRTEGLWEKSRAYLALLLEEHPWSDEANIAVGELRKGQ